VTVKELPDGPTPEAEAPAQLAAWAALPTPSIHIVLDEKGDMPTSRQFADKLAHWQNDSIKSLSILIGGANGTTAEVQKAANWVWSLGPLTYPHKLVRVLLAEQLYRAHTLLTGHPYHRD
jgi:23S rRNA (pseudouridine1915-N3)-methyltransferase